MASINEQIERLQQAFLDQVGVKSVQVNKTTIINDDAQSILDQIERLESKRDELTRRTGRTRRRIYNTDGR